MLTSPVEGAIESATTEGTTIAWPGGECMQPRALSVLIVEDDLQLGRALQRDLGRHGVIAWLARDRHRAEQALVESDVDIMLVDLQLGAEDGMLLLAQARRLSRRTRTILTSGYATQEERARAAELGARYLEKPFTPAQFFQVIEQVSRVKLQNVATNLLELLNALHRDKATAIVHVHGLVNGRICFVEGEITHAVRGEVVGVEALCDLISVPHRRIELDRESGATRTIASAFAPLVLRALEQLDRRERHPLTQ
ncbi:MAG TPA: response regulator [Polyangiaceae bacterium]|nr:response regulator [Polyangiaceae bacterium]